MPDVFIPWLAAPHGAKVAAFFMKKHSNIPIEVLTGKQLKSMMNKFAQRHFKMSAKKALKAIYAGKLPDSLSASHLKMCASLLEYGKEQGSGVDL